MLPEAHEMAEKAGEPFGLWREVLEETAPCRAILKCSVIRIGFFGDLDGGEVEQFTNPTLEGECSYMEVGVLSLIEALGVLKRVHDRQNRPMRTWINDLWVHRMIPDG